MTIARLPLATTVPVLQVTDGEWRVSGPNSVAVFMQCLTIMEVTVPQLHH